MSCVSILQSQLENPRKSQLEIETETDLHFESLLTPKSGIPVFYRKKSTLVSPTLGISLKQRLSQCAKIIRVSQVGQEIEIEPDNVLDWMLSDADLEAVKLALDVNATGWIEPVQTNVFSEKLQDPSKNELFADICAERIDYTGFCNVVASIEVDFPSLARKMKRVFLPSVFSTFLVDEFGTISTRAIMQYIKIKVAVVQHRLTLGLFDLDNTGYLSSQDLEQYILSQLPVMAQFANFNPSFYGFYMENALAKIFFILGKKRRICIRELIRSDVFKEFNEMREAEEIMNWFSPRVAMRIRGIFVNLDVDRDKYLTRYEFARICDGNLTEVFMDRLFEEYADHKVPGSGYAALSYGAFLEFLIASEYRHLPVGMKYFWKIFDSDHKGYLTLSNMNLFLRDINSKLISMRMEPYALDNLINELYDMIPPSDGVNITFDDLMSSRNGDLFCAILGDVNAFYLYSNRENFIAQTMDNGIFQLYFNYTGYSIQNPKKQPQFFMNA